MAKSLLDLATRLRTKAASLPQTASNQSIAMAKTIVGYLATNTPVDTTQALSNWIVTLDSPSTDKILPYVAGRHGETKAASASETIAAANVVLLKKKAGQVIYITNNQPYIQLLNDGTLSAQGSHFVESAVRLAELQNVFKAQS